MSSNQLLEEVFAEFAKENKQIKDENSDNEMPVEAVNEEASNEPAEDFSLAEIDFTDGFSLRDIRKKAKDYDSEIDVVYDLGRIMRFIEGSNMIVVLKTWNTAADCFGIELVNYGNLRGTLRTIKLEYHEKDHYTVADVLQTYLPYFSLYGICFSKNDNPNFFNLFRGWHFDLGDDAQTDQTLVRPFLRFTHEIIGNGDTATTNHILGWVASIIQNVGKKTGVALLLIGDEGAGKNFFTNILSTLFKGYSLSNITDLHHVVGHFNELIRGKVLIVVNEVENAKLNPKSQSEKLRSLITDDIVAIGQKYKATTLDANYANFVLVSNNDVPVRLGMNDRHYLCTRVSSKKMQDLQFFGALDEQTRTEAFFHALTAFFKLYDLSSYRVSDGLMNGTKRSILLEAADGLDNFVIDNYTKLSKGMSSDTIVPLISRYGFKTKDMFWKRLGTVTDKQRAEYNTKMIYKLKDWALLKYMSIAGSVGSE